MKTIKFFVVLLLLGTVGLGNAWADRRHGGHSRHAHSGVVIGPYWRPWYYPPPPYFYYPHSYPRVVIEAPDPEVYIEQQQAPVTDPGTPAESTVAAPTSYWYYCDAERGYYPYVAECPGGWQKVLPHPPRQP